MLLTSLATVPSVELINLLYVIQYTTDQRQLANKILRSWSVYVNIQKMFNDILSLPSKRNLVFFKKKIHL